MKIIRILLFCLLALSLIACTGIFIFFQTFDTDQYLHQVTKKASAVLGRPVSVGHAGLGLSSRGITLDVGPLTVADDPNFTTQPFIKVDRVRVSLDLRSLILHREIHIRNILVQSPEIHFIRSEDGGMNIRSIIGPLSNTKRPNFIGTKSSASAIVKSEVAKQLLSLSQDSQELAPMSNVNSITIQNASISFIDQNHTFPLDIWLKSVNARLNDFSPTKSFQLSSDASFCSNVPNVHEKALVSIDLLKRSVQLSDLEFQMDLLSLDINQLKGISPAMIDSPIFKNIPGVVQLKMAHLEMSAAGDITANGDINITGGVIKHFNIIKMLLSHMMEIFGSMGGNMDNLLNGQLKSKLGAEDTTIKKVQAQFSFHDKTVFIDDSLLQTDIFELKAKGSMDQGLNMNMQTMLHLNDDVSAALVDEFEGLKYFMDDSQRIAIDASLTGVFPHLKYKPSKDFRKKSKKVLMEEGGNILGVLLGSRK